VLGETSVLRSLLNYLFGPALWWYAEPRREG
jgi:hypothetical protein